ncbi:MAG: TonB family protein [Bryobacteraceae bacterium]|jgi:TonB family protein
MSTGLILNNLVSYSLQIGMLVGLAAFVPALLRLRQPGARLVYWHILLAACLLLPLAQPWKPAIIAGTVEITTVITAVRPTVHASRFSTPRSEIALLVLASGALVRLFWLAVGFWKLRRYRRRSQPLQPAPTWGVEASLRVSGDILSPVTFGWRRPVVLLPKAFPALDDRVQDAILCHEVLHVRRRDWLFTLVEELVRAAFWFHPAIWWLLGEIGLAREQEVDRLAIEITQQRDEYMDALLAIAGSRGSLDLAPAPLFLRKRHLKQRFILILTEARMSKTRLISALTASVVVLIAACWLVTGTFPLMAAPQVVPDAPGVTVGLNGASLLHRSPVDYPAAALRAGIQGTLSVEVKTDAKGNVIDAHVLSGPDELRKAALQSVLQWHFTSDSAGATRVAQITFELPKTPDAQAVSTPTARAGVGSGVGNGVGVGVSGGVQGGVSNGVQGGVIGGRITASTVSGGIFRSGSLSGSIPPPSPGQAEVPLRIQAINVDGLPEQARDELLSRLPVHEGDIFSNESVQKVSQAAKDFDEHLSVRFSAGSNGVSIQILAPGAEPPAPQRIKVGGNVQAVMVLTKVTPVYPQLAKSARVEGVVHLAVIIAKDGTVQEIRSLDGPALLIQSAMDAVKQWVYRPTLLNGQPVQVETTVDINFTLSQ